MNEITLGRSGLRVSRIALGTSQLGGDWGATDESAAIAAIRRAADSGITMFDTAQAYGFGESERLLAKALRGRNRDELVIATKGGLRPAPGGRLVLDASPDWIRASVEASLRALRTDYIDLYQVHWPDPVTPLADTAETLAKLVADGKIRHVGVSNFDASQIEEFGATLPAETLQSPYHLFQRDIEAGLLPYAAAREMGVLAYGPLAHGLLSGQLTTQAPFDPADWRSRSDLFTGDAYARNLKAVAWLRRLARDELGTTVSRLAVAWTLANPAVHVAIVGTRSPAHVDDAIAAAALDLDDLVLARIGIVMQMAVRSPGQPGFIRAKLAS